MNVFFPLHKIQPIILNDCYKLMNDTCPICLTEGLQLFYIPSCSDKHKICVHCRNKVKCCPICRQELYDDILYYHATI